MMKQRHLKNNNKGYSLVEMIICIAVIAILSGIALVTITLLHSAKAKEASGTFTSELSDTAIKAKNQVVVIETDDGSKVKYPNYNFCLKLYKDDDRYYIKKGYYNPEAGSEATKYIFPEAGNPNDGKGISLSSKVTITYTPEGGTEADLDYVYIVYDRKGRCINGSGMYSFYKNQEALIADVKVNKNGSYQSY